MSFVYIFEAFNSLHMQVRVSTGRGKNPIIIDADEGLEKVKGLHRILLFDFIT